MPSMVAPVVGFALSRHAVASGRANPPQNGGFPPIRPGAVGVKYVIPLESAFARFGGVSAELLFDPMRAVVLSDDRTGGGELVMNAEFLRFSAHWGFVVRPCRAYRPQTKGKVERPIRYLRGVAGVAAVEGLAANLRGRAGRRRATGSSGSTTAPRGRRGCVGGGARWRPRMCGGAGR